MKRKIQSLLAVIALMLLFCSLNVFAADKTVELKNKQIYDSSIQTKTDGMVYHKITIPSNGYILVAGTSYNQYGNLYGLNVEFLNSKRTKLRKSTDYLNAENNIVQYYGVKRGTYYLRVRTYTSGNDYQLCYQFTKINEKSGTKKSKAVSLKKKKTVKGLMVAGEKGNKVDWYKIKLTKKTKVRIRLDGATCGSIQLQVIPASTKVRLYNAYINVNQDAKVLSFNKKLSAGTYYIKITRSASNKYTSGAYAVKWY